MKEKNLFLHAMLVCVATAMSFGVTSCSDDYDTPDFPIESKHESGTLVYVWDLKSDHSDSTSPFVSQPGKDMEVWIVENSKDIESYGKKASGSPIAKIHVTTAKDTVWVSSVDELKDFIDKTGNISALQSAQQKFGSELQEIVFDWSCEGNEATLASKPASMPYYPLEPVNYKGLSVKDLGMETVNGKEYQLYEVSANFSQKTTQKNEKGQSAEVEIEYVVKYIGAEELELVMVEYFPGGYWAEPHDNMRLMYCAHVERYRTYSNGERVGPDRFEDYGHWTSFPHGGIALEGYNDLDVGWAEGGPITLTEIGDSIGILHQSIKVSEMFTYNYTEWNSNFVDDGFKNWNRYVPSNTIDDERFDIGKGVYCPVDYEEDSRPNGWYYNSFRYKHSVFVIPENGEEDPWELVTLAVGFMFYDQFFIIDGRRIDFSSLHNLKMDFNVSEQPFSELGKKGKIVKLGMDIAYLGKNFHGEQLDSIYVEK